MPVPGVCLLRSLALIHLGYCIRQFLERQAFSSPSWGAVLVQMLAKHDRACLLASAHWSTSAHWSAYATRAGEGARPSLSRSFVSADTGQHKSQAHSAVVFLDGALPVDPAGGCSVDSRTSSAAVSSRGNGAACRELCAGPARSTSFARTLVCVWGRVIEPK